MRLLLAIALLALSAAPALAQSVDERYRALVEQAKSNPAAVDVARLRAAYAESSFYRAYDSDPAALGAPNEAVPADQVRAFVDANFALMSSHLVAVERLGYTQGMPEFELHARLYSRIADHIAGTGDGKSAATAYEVLVVGEEYNFMNWNEIQPIDQRLVQERDGAFDVFNARRKSDELIELWFDVTPLLMRASELR